jgi:hypothetical protein
MNYLHTVIKTYEDGSCQTKTWFDTNYIINSLIRFDNGDHTLIINGQEIKDNEAYKYLKMKAFW